MTAQAAFERANSSKRAAETGIEDISASETEGTTRKLSKSDSVLSTLDFLEEDSEEECDEVNLSLTLRSDQTTVIEQETTIVETKKEPSVSHYIQENTEVVTPKSILSEARA